MDNAPIEKKDGGNTQQALRRVEDTSPASPGTKPEARVQIFLRGDESAFGEGDHRGKVLVVFAAVTLFLCSVSLLFPAGGPVRLRERILRASTTAELDSYKRWAQDGPALKHLLEVKRFVLQVRDADLNEIRHDSVVAEAQDLQQADSKGLGLLLDELTGTGTHASRIETTSTAEQIHALLRTLKDLQQVVDEEKTLEPQMAPLRDLRERICIALLAQPSKQKTSRELLVELRELARGLPRLEGLTDEARDPWGFLNALAPHYRSDGSLGRLTVWQDITVREVLEDGVQQEKRGRLGKEDARRLERVDAFLRAGGILEEIKALGELEASISGQKALVKHYRLEFARRLNHKSLPPAFAPNETAYEAARDWWNNSEGALREIARDAGIEGFDGAAARLAGAFKEGKTFAGRMQKVAQDAGNELRRALEENGGAGPSWEALRRELREARPEGGGAQEQLKQTEALLDLASGPGMQAVRWTHGRATLSEASVQAAKLELVQWLAKRLHPDEPSVRKLLRNEDLPFDCKALGCSITFGYNRKDDVKKVGKRIKNVDWGQLGSTAATDLLQQVGSAIWLAYVQCQRDRSALDTGWLKAPSLRHVPVAESDLSGAEEIAACSLLNRMPLLFEPAEQATWFQCRERRADSLPALIQELADHCDIVYHRDFVRRSGISPLYHGAVYRSVDQFRTRAVAEFGKGPAGLARRLDELASECFRDSSSALQVDEVEHLLQLARAEAFLRYCIQNGWYPRQKSQQLGPHDLRQGEWKAAVPELLPVWMVVKWRSDIDDPAELLGYLGDAAVVLSDKDVLDGSTLSLRELAQLVLAERAYLGRHYELNLGDKGPFGSWIVIEGYEDVWQRNKKPFRDVFPGLPPLP